MATPVSRTIPQSAAAGVRRAAAVFALAAVAAFGERRAAADLDFAMQNGATVDSTLSPATETESFHVRLAAGARLSATASPKKRRGSAVPSLSLRVLDSADAAVAVGDRHGPGARLAGYVVTASGEYRIVVAGDGIAAGAYRLAVAWTPPPNVRGSLTLATGDVAVAFAADAGSKATFSVKSASGSSALPRLIDVRSQDGAFVHTLAPPADAAARSHTAKRVALAGGGDFVLDVADAGVSGGDAVVRIDVRPPPVRKRRFDVSHATPGAAGGDMRAAPLGPAGGAIVFDAVTGGELAGASVSVPAHALTGGTAVVIGPGAAFAATDAALGAGGPAVFFGPSGLRFTRPVTVSIPFDPTGLAGDFTSLRIFERSADGTVSLVPTSGYVFDAAARTVSFPVSHFTSFRAFAPSVKLNETVRLLPADGAAGDIFGNAVALSGDTAVVGANLADAAGADSGAAYVFVRAAGAWSPQAKLVAADAAAVAYFGSQVAVDGDTAAVGAFGEAHAGSGSGAVYVFDRVGTTWTQTQKLVAADGAAGQNFGVALALNRDTIVVGAYGDTNAGTYSGAAYVFTRSGGTWTQQKKLTASDGRTNDLFGYAVGIDGDTAVVGAPVVVGTVANTGAAYVFNRAAGVWSEQAKLRAADVAIGDEFAISVAVSGDTALAGSYLRADFGTASGSAYVYERTKSAWTQSAKLHAPGAAANDWFGLGVALEGDTALVSLSRGPAAGVDAVSGVAFRRSGGEWTERATLSVSTAAAGDNVSGVPLAISGTTVLNGASRAGPLGVGSGAAYVFDLVK